MRPHGLTVESKIYRNLVHLSNLPIKRPVMFVCPFSSEIPFTCRVISSELSSGLTQIGEVDFIIPVPGKLLSFLYYLLI